jgi:hypothetical protein
LADRAYSTQIDLDSKGAASLYPLSLVLSDGIAYKLSPGNHVHGLEKIIGCDNPERVLDVVFVHGLGGSARSTWHPKDQPDHFWPLWLGEDFPNIGIWTLGYAASVSRWKEESMPLADRGISVLEVLYAEHIGDRPIVFITHSMGGLVVKQFLRHADSFGVPRWETISHRTVGIAFLATPHSGANLANFAELVRVVLRTNEQLEDLRQHSARLAELHGWFLSYQSKQKIVCRSYCERRELRPEVLGLKLPKGMIVVDATSAEPNILGERAIPQDDDHISICKPASRDVPLYKSIRRFIEECFLSQNSPNTRTSPLGAQQPHRAWASWQESALKATAFATQGRIVEDYNRRFVGRQELLRAFKRFIDTQSSGYFVIRAGPGAGKTAIACHLVKEYDAIFHLVSRTDARADPDLILRSIIAQLIARMATQVPDPPASENATETLTMLLADAAALRPVVLVLDAIDELPDTDDLPFFVTDGLPDGVHIVITARPSNNLDRLMQSLFKVHYAIHDLDPLQPADMEQILHSMSPGITPERAKYLTDSSKGNPLYLIAAAQEELGGADFSTEHLPASVEGFFRHSTARIRTGDERVLQQLLGVLGVARRPLGILELSQILELPQRIVHEQGIRPIRQFLLEVNGAYQFYHELFHYFTTNELLYADEIQLAHRMISAWLQQPPSRALEYRYESLAHHLYCGGNRCMLTKVIDHSFMAEKMRRTGYGVLEDVELLARAMLDSDDPDVVEESIKVVESLRGVAGSDTIRDAARALRAASSSLSSSRRKLNIPCRHNVRGLDVYALVLPKADVAADLCEIFPLPDRVLFAIGDAPGTGLKSAFVARFIGNLFRKLATTTSNPDLGEMLQTVASTIKGRAYFSGISMQFVEVNPARGLLTIVNAAHPFPVLYSARRGQCDELPVRGSFVVSPFGNADEQWEVRHVEIDPGDILVLFSDGLTEDQFLSGKSYSYRFMEIVRLMHDTNARSIGEAILRDWEAFGREKDQGDDVTLVIAALKNG